MAKSDENQRVRPSALSARTLLDSVFAFLALYLTTLFSLDTFDAARKSPFSQAQGSAAWRNIRTERGDPTPRASGIGPGRPGQPPRTLHGLDTSEGPKLSMCPGGSCG